MTAAAAAPGAAAVAAAQCVLVRFSALHLPVSDSQWHYRPSAAEDVAAALASQSLELLLPLDFQGVLLVSSTPAAVAASLSADHFSACPAFSAALLRLLPQFRALAGTAT